MALPIGPIHHVAILVEDLEGAERFYAGVLGLSVDRRWPDDAGGTRSVWLTLPGGAILMLERAAPGATRRATDGGGWHLIALSIPVTARAAVESALAAAGIPIERRTDYTLYLRDPEHNLLALSHHPAKAHPAKAGP